MNPQTYKPEHFLVGVSTTAIGAHSASTGQSAKTR